MKTICAWCKKHLSGSGDKISHGICKECKEKLENEHKKKENKK